MTVEPDRRAYGSWPSPLSARAVARGALRLAEPRLDRGTVYWLEGRPAEGGRSVLLRSSRDGDVEECVGPDANVRSRVHEYGGGAYLVSDGRTFVVDDAAERLIELGQGPLGRSDARYADLALSPDGAWLVAVEEVAGEGPGGEPANRLVALARGGERRVIDGSRDFVSFPTFAPDGRALAWTGWDHPHMPWDETGLYVVAWGEDGPGGTVRRVAGGPGESIFQPRFGRDGRLYFASDRSGWWNLYVLEDGEPRALLPMQAEFATAQWVFGLSRYDFVDADTLLCVRESGGEASLGRLDLRDGELRTIALGLTAIEGLRVEAGLACFVGASPTSGANVYVYELAAQRLHAVRASFAVEPDTRRTSLPEPIEFPSEGGRRAHAFFYAPRAPESRGLPNELPPLLVRGHGGPTAVSHPTLDLRVQYWTSRGVAVVDVNYGGSTGFGRAYREQLDGRWGIVDVEDCIAAARFLAAAGRVDARRLLITGGSAGGYTTLCALTFHDVFRAGASHYGIGDLAALARDTHKFESRYTDRLVAPHADHEALYRERSPIHHVEGLSCPVIFFQGSEDRVVPPGQAEAMVAALAARGIPHAYVSFEGEGHGFRRAHSIQVALEGELYFYSRILGFDVDVHPPEVRIVGGVGGA
jgi:dipeptidyl aminopeptidase/acylaminoacyl peptidase